MIAVGVRLVQTCEALCDELRRAVGLTFFRLELDRRTTPLVITLRSSEADSYDPRHAWMRPPTPARIQIPVHDGERRVGELRIEDDRRGAYPPEALAEVDRIVTRHRGHIVGLLEEAQL